MNSFRYLPAHTPQQAADALGPNGRYLAGGIDLLGEMKDYIVSPDVLVALRLNSSSPKIRPTAAGQADLWVNADATMTELAEDTGLQTNFSALAQAAGEVGSPQIRNVATIGGNLLQHSRCWYYRQPDLTCLKRGGTTCYGQAGENKYLALFSGCDCVSPIVSNTSVALAALDAQVHVRTAAGKSVILTLAQLYAPAWKVPTAHNSLAPGDLVTGVSIPAGRSRSAYRQISEKREFDWALVSCAAAGNVTNGRLSNVRLALGAIAPGPHVVDEAHAFLEGETLNEEAAVHAADLILRDAKPLAQNGYKIPLAHALIRRTLLALNP